MAQVLAKAPLFPLAAADSSRLPYSDRRGLPEKKDIDGRNLETVVQPVHPLTVRPASQVPKRRAKGGASKPPAPSDKLPTLLPPEARPSASPCTEKRACMHCWGALGTLYCSDCSQILCGVCAIKTHSTGANRSHLIYTASRGGIFEFGTPGEEKDEEAGGAGGGKDQDGKRSKDDSFNLNIEGAAWAGSVKVVKTCEKHPGEGLSFACVDCDYLPICVQCMDTAAHAGHFIISMREAAPIVRKKLVEQASALSSRIADLQSIDIALRNCKLEGCLDM
ncbi:b-box zinc finger domain-containing protein [Cystoisospora suis]|uniref:B-box zinc finger domain-containing protein n=1 Tax=Cystoisospora suis TaxID=483139 RepID=A0A2C6KE35_9APIC|nr:b-box zinc finger domain-containing protein [Cystoisospora suis]